MAFWIYIVIAVIGIIIISMIVFVVKCVGYKKVLRKMRTLSTSSSENEDDSEAAGASHSSVRRPRRNVNVIVPPPPSYVVSLQHPVLLRGLAVNNTEMSRDAAINDNNTDATSTDVESGNRGATSTERGIEAPSTDTNAHMWSGAAFPGELLFILPPYCEEPPAYTETCNAFNASHDT